MCLMSIHVTFASPNWGGTITWVTCQVMSHSRRRIGGGRLHGSHVKSCHIRVAELGGDDYMCLMSIHVTFASPNWGGTITCVSCQFMSHTRRRIGGGRLHVSHVNSHSRRRIGGGRLHVSHVNSCHIGDTPQKREDNPIKERIGSTLCRESPARCSAAPLGPPSSKPKKAPKCTHTASHLRCRCHLQRCR
jgi:hypothetical protein